MMRMMSLVNPFLSYTRKCSHDQNGVDNNAFCMELVARLNFSENDG